jgi:hypothetical protein
VRKSPCGAVYVKMFPQKPDWFNWSVSTSGVGGEVSPPRHQGFQSEIALKLCLSLFVERRLLALSRKKASPFST